MDLKTLRTEIQARTEDSSITSSQIDRWVNLGIKQWATRSDWLRIVEQDSTETTVAGTAEYDFPDDFKKMFGVRVSASVGGTESDATEYSFINFKNKNVDASGNWYYFNPEGKVGLIPTPGTTGLTIYMKYYRIPVDLVADEDEPPFDVNYHELLVFFALKKYWETTDDFQKARYYDAEFENMIDHMKVDLLVRSTGQLGRVKDIRELLRDNQPQKRNAINLGK